MESLERQTSLFESIAREEKKAREEEIKRLWNAVDTHTHDFTHEPPVIATNVVTTTQKISTVPERDRSPTTKPGVLQRSMTSIGTSRSLAFTPGQVAISKTTSAQSPRTLKTMATMPVQASFAGAPPPQASLGRLPASVSATTLTSPGKQVRQYASGSGSAPIGSGGASPSGTSLLASFQNAGSITASPGGVPQSPRGLPVTPRDQTFQLAMVGSGSAVANAQGSLQTVSKPGSTKCGTARYSNRVEDEVVSSTSTSAAVVGAGPEGTREMTVSTSRKTQFEEKSDHHPPSRSSVLQLVREEVANLR